MSKAILEDAEERPDLFVWFGSIAPERLDTWLDEQRLAVPEDLRKLWQETGGDLFESETILGPLGNSVLGDDVVGANTVHQARGLPATYLLFYSGFTLTAIRLADQRIVELVPDTYQEGREHPSLDAWYRHVIRKEFAFRYGMRHDQAT